MNRSTSSSKILIPLATLVVAGAVAVGSGASFTSESASAVRVTSGTLKHTNSQNGNTLEIKNIRPGETQTGSLTLTNNGSIDSTLTIEESADTSGFVAGDLKLKITDGSATVFDGNFGDMVNTKQNLVEAFPVGQTRTLTFVVSMPAEAGNLNQGKTATARYDVVQTQVNTPTTTVEWIKGLLPVS